MSVDSSGRRSDTASPCIGVCSTALGDDICRGCGRSFEEVLNWHSYSDDQKRAVNARLAKRQMIQDQRRS